MTSLEAQLHDFRESEWPFSDPISTVVVSTRQVFKGNLPVLLVSHDDDGDWQVLCATTNDTDDALVVCLGCAYQRDKTLGALADLPRGWFAWREAADRPWIRELKEPDADYS